MIRKRHNLVSIMLVLIFGFALFYSGTDGFRAYTAETARVNQLIDEKPVFPDVLLEDSKGEKYTISEFSDSYVLITFIYTTCTSICVDLEWNMSEVYERIPSKYLGDEINFLSISFDPTRDTPAILDMYREYFGSDGETWRMARISDQVKLDALLKKFGVIVIPDENGNFAHNAAFYLVDKKGRLVNVLDYTKIEEAAETIISMIENDMEE